MLLRAANGTLYACLHGVVVCNNELEPRMMSFSWQKPTISCEVNSLALSTRKYRVLRPVMTTYCVSNSTGVPRPRVFLGYVAQCSVPLSKISKKYRFKEGSRPRLQAQSNPFEDQFWEENGQYPREGQEWPRQAREILPEVAESIGRIKTWLVAKVFAKTGNVGEGASLSRVGRSRGLKGWIVPREVQ